MKRCSIPVTAISGSGPAYVFYFIEALQDAARRHGIQHGPGAGSSPSRHSQGRRSLRASRTSRYRVLRERVTSKGGTTAAALARLDQHDVRSHIVEAARAARDRAAKLGEEFDLD